MIRETAEAASQAASKAAIATKAWIGGSGASTATWLACETGLTGDDWTTVFGGVGALVGVVGVAANIYFKHQHLKLARLNGRPDPQA